MCVCLCARWIQQSQSVAKNVTSIQKCFDHTIFLVREHYDLNSCYIANVQFTSIQRVCVCVCVRVCVCGCVCMYRVVVVTVLIPVDQLFMM